MSELVINAKVRIVGGPSAHVGKTGVVYGYVPMSPVGWDRRWCPWQVRIDGESEGKAGMAYLAEELEVIEEKEAVQ
ncbi:MAG TPA: hypothetical protein VH593_06480 [Ktedonobacteraceae bacterium]|jgi:hypothetical protein